VQEVEVVPVPLGRLALVVSAERAALLADVADAARTSLDGRVFWNVSSTAQGGGVAEMLQTLLAYSLGAGIDTRWLVLTGDAAFFEITKRLHNWLHGDAGDGGTIGDDEHRHYEAVLADNLDALADRVHAGDLVLLHDPQTAGMARRLKEAGAHVVWRCHIGSDSSDDLTDQGWAFLRPYLEDADAFVFSRRQFAPPWIAEQRLSVIPPSLDPFSPKNTPLDAANVRATLHRAGILDGVADDDNAGGFVRRDGTAGVTRAHRDLLVGGERVPAHARVVVQVSRWDRLKDMAGVQSAFAGATAEVAETHLVLAGPDVSGVSDDPEGATVLAECRAIWERLGPDVRSRIHLCCLPMDDLEENAHIVNCLQTYASVVVQKSLAEGFGLTVTEPMWKGRPVLASAVGGIQDQIVDGVSGVLLPDPHDLADFARLLSDLLAEPERAARIGAAAHERVRELFLGDRHLIQYGELFRELV
jgi:trehalose synthase